MIRSCSRRAFQCDFVGPLDFAISKCEAGAEQSLVDNLELRRASTGSRAFKSEMGDCEAVLHYHIENVLQRDGSDSAGSAA
jgi:hypothetical protein